MKKNFGVLILLTFLSVNLLPAQQKQLSLNDFLVNGTFSTKGVSGLRSMNDGEHYTVLEDRGTKIVKYSYKTGKPSLRWWI